MPRTEEATPCGPKTSVLVLPGRRNFMAHLNPLEKEFLIRQFRLNGRIKLSDFCTMHNVSDTAFRKWLKQYEEGGLEGLSRADVEIK